MMFTRVSLREQVPDLRQSSSFHEGCVLLFAMLGLFQLKQQHLSITNTAWSSLDAAFLQ
jgi:hypothetical protein